MDRNSFLIAVNDLSNMNSDQLKDLRVTKIEWSVSDSYWALQSF